MLSILGALALLHVQSGCAMQAGPPELSTTEGEGTTLPTAPMDPCASPREGCPCDTPGAEIACKGGTTRDGDYVTCPDGKRTCSVDGTWGECRWPHRYVPPRIHP